MKRQLDGEQAEKRDKVSELSNDLKRLGTDRDRITADMDKLGPILCNTVSAEKKIRTSYCLSSTGANPTTLFLQLQRQRCSRQ
jgi:hypothetical protein